MCCVVGPLSSFNWKEAQRGSDERSFIGDQNSYVGHHYRWLCIASATPELSSRRASLLIGQYQITLLGERCTRTCERLAHSRCSCDCEYARRNSSIGFKRTTYIDNNRIFFVESSETASCNSCFTSSKFVLTETAKHRFPVVNLNVGVPHGSAPVCVVGRLLQPGWYIMTDHGVHNNQHADDIANHLLS